MDTMEQRAAIRFCFKLGKTATETFDMITQAYQNEALSRKNVFKWFALFRDGRESIEDLPRPGVAKTGRSEEHIKQVADILKNDRCVSLRLIEEMTGIPKNTVHNILTKDLGKQKICSRFVPHLLTDEQKEARIQHCIDMKSEADSDPNFLNSIVTADETWCFQYEPLTKRQSSEWVGPSDPRPKKLRFQKSKIKTMLTVFLDSKGIIHQEYTPQGQSINGEYYLGMLKRLLARVQRVRPEYRRPGSWSFLHDNAPAHKCLAVRKFLADKGIPLIDHPPYSPDLAPCDFWLFPKLKISIKGHRFDSVTDIQRSVTAFLRGIPEADYHECFKSFYARFQRCIDSQGVYFE